MTAAEINNGNRIIAEFDGIRKKKTGAWQYKRNGDWFRVEGLRYHFS